MGIVPAGATQTTRLWTPNRSGNGCLQQGADSEVPGGPEGGGHSPASPLLWAVSRSGWWLHPDTVPGPVTWQGS